MAFLFTFHTPAMGRGAAMRETNKNGRQLAGVRRGNQEQAKEPPTMAEENQTGADGQQEPEQHSPAPKDVNNAKLRTFTRGSRPHKSTSVSAGNAAEKATTRSSRRRPDRLPTSNRNSPRRSRRTRSSKAKPNRPNTRRSSPRYAPTSRPNTASPTRAVLAGDDEKQIGEYAEKLMKVFADMRSRARLRTRAPAPDRPRLNIPAARTSSTP